MHTVESLKAILAQHDRPGLALDIDDTLCHLGRKWYDTMVEIAGHPGLTYEEITHSHSGGFQHVPAWKGHPGIEAWIQKTLVDHEHYLGLEPIEQAREGVQKISALVPVHAYITMRSLAVIDASHAWLRRHGFPDLPILSRPLDVPKERIHAWKAQALADLYPTIQGIVDDDPNVVMNLPPGYQGTIFLYGKTSHPRADLSIIPCKDWDEVYTKVQGMTKG
jgi:hypothetical protein